MKDFLKQYWMDAAAVLVFLAIAWMYFLKPVSDGLVLSGGDHTGGVGSGVEINAYRKAHGGETPRWTGVLFSGMPTYQIAPSYDSTETLSFVERIYSLGTTGVVMYVFIMLLGFYIMLRAFDFKAWMAALGAILWAFSSYFFIIIGAGHIWKVLTLAFIPPTIGGMVLCYRGRYMLGTALTGLFAAMQVLSNHVQMSYYFLPVLLVLVCSYAWDAFKQKAWAHWSKATACVVAGGLLGILVNLSSLYHTYEYSKHTMRSKTELTATTDQEAANQTSSGLDRDYITQWSYGIDETWTLLVPGCKGGRSEDVLAQSKTAMEKANPQYAPIYNSLRQYWGEQPMTSGPVYVGALVLVLAVLSLFICRTPLTYGLAVLTVLSIALSWGKNMMWLTDLFIDYVPMYDKFRTVSSILVVAEFTLPLMAMLAIKRIAEDKDVFARGRISILYAVFGAFAAILLFMWWCPDAFFSSFVSTNEQNMLNNAAQAGYIPQEMLSGICSNITDMRHAVLASECKRSLIVILLGLVPILLFNASRGTGKKVMSMVSIACIAVLCMADMWMVNKRYLNDAMFSKPKPNAEVVAATPADQFILQQDAGRDYRVLNYTDPNGTFNENNTSFYHRSIGGYHPAKLRRYQEMIERHIAPEMSAFMQAASATMGQLDSLSCAEADNSFPVLNMLNMRYAIYNPEAAPLHNPHALGCGWFVQDIDYVATADDEMGHLSTQPLRTTAVVMDEFRADTEGKLTPGTVQMAVYECNAQTYDVASEDGGLLVLSEVYYPGWRAYIDGDEVPVSRANYILRCMRVPAGQHKLEMRFDPQSLHITEGVAYTAFGLLMLLMAASLAWSLRRRKA